MKKGKNTIKRRQGDLYGFQMLNSLPRNCKISIYEESGYNSDMTTIVDTKYPKKSEKAKNQIPMVLVDILLILS